MILTNPLPLPMRKLKTTSYCLPLLLLLTVDILIFSCSPPSSSVEQSSLPNILVIFADDLGFGDLGTYGHPMIKTPNLDQMAEEGAKLTSFYVAASVCTPSRGALLTGRYPITTGITNNFGPDSKGGLPLEEVTIAEYLKPLGYATKAIGKWHLGSVKGFMPPDQGFDEYYGLLYSNDMIPPWVQTERPLQLYRNYEPLDESPVDQSTLTYRYTNEALSFIESTHEKQEPFFIYLAHSLPHLPLSASENFVGTSDGGLYGDVIEELDYNVGRLLSKLDELGIDENTLVIFTSDNGPWRNMPPRMYETEAVEKWHGGTTGSLAGHKATSFEGGFRVPGIIKWEGKIPASQVISEMATTMDIFPTITHLTEGNENDLSLEGHNIWPLLTEQASTPYDYFYYTRGNNLRGIRDKDWKLLVSKNLRSLRSHELASDEETVYCELYNTHNDPFEYWDVSAEHPDVFARLYKQMESFAQEKKLTIEKDVCLID